MLEKILINDIDKYYEIGTEYGFFEGYSLAEYLEIMGFFVNIKLED